MGRTKVRFWALAGACLLMVAVGAISAHGAIETPTQGMFKGKTMSSAPRWLSLFGVAIKPDGSIYIVGSKALLLISKDQGKTWQQNTLQERPGGVLFQDRDLYSIRFTPDGKVGWICGEEGIILRSDDGGKSWARQKSGTEKNLFKLYVADAQHAYAVGADGSILRTTDGQNWQEIKPPKNVSFFDITFSDPNTGWIVGEFSTVLKTTDAGATWTVNYGGNTGDYTVGPWFTIHFANPQTGTIAGLAGDLLVTSDGGRTWQKAKLPDQMASYVVAQNPSNQSLWIAGNGGNMFDRSTSGQWRSLERATFNDITDLMFVGKQGFAVGLNGTILRTENAGEQWQVVQ